jgi:flagellar hook protein FlgE
MSFQTGLSGLNAASKNLDVIGNNIANANTAGAKRSRAEFAEVIASTLGAGGSGGQTGIGVEVSAISQEFSQGNISVTGNTLDIAINGDGFFPLIPLNAQGLDRDKPSLYSRSGIFKLDADGYIVNNNGEKLFGYNNTTTPAGAGALFIDTTRRYPPSATTNVELAFNLNAGSAVWTSPKAFDVSPTFTTYDSQGNTKDVQLYIRKIATNQWAVRTTNDPATTPVPPALDANDIGRLTFDANGALQAVDIWDNATSTFTASAAESLPISWTTSIGTFNANVDFTNSTQYASSYSLTTLDQDGYSEGSFSGLKISESGIITARYDNGKSIDACQIQLASFRNNQGLQPVGGGNWMQTNASGLAVLGEPTTASLGSVRSGALEDSNVDLTAELVAMMTAQRAYQANAQTIKTQDQVLSTLLNMR